MKTRKNSNNRGGTHLAQMRNSNRGGRRRKKAAQSRAPQVAPQVTQRGRDRRQARGSDRLR
ncbi:hypothetical protein PIB30_077780, partial [Stylosanthes scabra]|nr:hypothetical protein [Stylosanthes scabra]